MLHEEALKSPIEQDPDFQATLLMNCYRYIRLSINAGCSAGTMLEEWSLFFKEHFLDHFTRSAIFHILAGSLKKDVILQ